jgi:hypothetical protein
LETSDSRDWTIELPADVCAVERTVLIGKDPAIGQAIAAAQRRLSTAEYVPGNPIEGPKYQLWRLEKLFGTPATGFVIRPLSGL